MLCSSWVRSSIRNIFKTLVSVPSARNVFPVPSKHRTSDRTGDGSLLDSIVEYEFRKGTVRENLSSEGFLRLHRCLLSISRVPLCSFGLILFDKVAVCEELSYGLADARTIVLSFDRQRYLPSFDAVHDPIR